MKKILSILPILVLIASVQSCYKTVESMGNNNNSIILAFPAAKNYNVASSGINYWNKALLNLDLSKQSVVVKLSANLSRPLSNDVTFQLKLNNNALQTYNEDSSHHTKYALMPEEYFSLGNESVVLPAGQTDTTFEITFYPSKFDISQTGYMLPVTISSEGHPTNSEMNTVYFHIEKDPFPPYGTSDWVVTGFSSEEANGEGPNNGRVAQLFDNNPASFWHSQWQGAVPGPPHWFSVDMASPKSLHGIMFLARQCGCTNRPKNVIISGSNDGINWNHIQDLTLSNTTVWQKFNFTNEVEPVRYLKITITGMFDAQTYTNMAEVKVF